MILPWLVTRPPVEFNFGSNGEKAARRSDRDAPIAWLRGWDSHNHCDFDPNN
eukprot:COSAG02_NODE_16968_length_1039_cov_1.967021_1_plen_51_part_10